MACEVVNFKYREHRSKSYPQEPLQFYEMQKLKPSVIIYLKVRTSFINVPEWNFSRSLLYL